MFPYQLFARMSLSSSSLAFPSPLLRFQLLFACPVPSSLHEYITSLVSRHTPMLQGARRRGLFEGERRKSARRRRRWQSHRQPGAAAQARGCKECFSLHHASCCTYDPFQLVPLRAACAGLAQPLQVPKVLGDVCGHGERQEPAASQEPGCEGSPCLPAPLQLCKAALCSPPAGW